MKILALTQARIGSTRFPEKVLKEINGQSLLHIHLKRILRSKLITKTMVATTHEPKADQIVSISNNIGVSVYKGDEQNVLKRFYDAALKEQPDWVVRLTSDCPLVDPVEIDKVIQHALDNDLDYVSNFFVPTFPDGMDAEIFKFSALEIAYQEAQLKSELEHVTPYISKNSSLHGQSVFISDYVSNAENFSDVRLTVDTVEDFVVIEKLIDALGTERPWMDYVRQIQTYPEIGDINQIHRRNEGYLKSLEDD